MLELGKKFQIDKNTRRRNLEGHGAACKPLIQTKVEKNKSAEDPMEKNKRTNDFVESPFRACLFEGN